MRTKQIVLLLIGIIIINSCKKDKGDLSTVVTYAPTYVASTSTIIGCDVKSNGGSGIAACGVYLGSSANPESTGTKLQITKLQMGNDTGLFLGKVTGLIPGTRYYMKAFATNTKGEALGAEINFTTPATIKDYDNNVYETVGIGTQSWMAKNLVATHYQNGDAINTTNPAMLNITSETSPKYQWTYGGVDVNASVYGRLYTWYAVTDSRKICPAGWHIPTDAEWTVLENKLGSYIIAGSMLKESGNNHWSTPYNLDATDESCFTALPGGYRDGNGTFYLLQNNGYWWSSTESEAASSWARILSTNNTLINRSGTNKSWGLSVRCVKD